jgi:hypothetical protein
MESFLEMMRNCCTTCGDAYFDPNVQVSTESETTTSTFIMYIQPILNYQVLAISPSLNKEQGQQLTRTVYKGARFILQAHAIIDGYFAVWKHVLFHMYNFIRRHEGDQLTIPALLHALSQLDSPVQVIHITDTSHSLEQDKIQSRAKLDAEDSGRTTQSSSLNAKSV